MVRSGDKEFFRVALQHPDLYHLQHVFQQKTNCELRQILDILHPYRRRKIPQGKLDILKSQARGPPGPRRVYEIHWQPCNDP